MVTYRIGEAAQASGISVRTIRYYEGIGLIPEARRHNALSHTGGNRVFDESDIGRLKFIHHARMLELGLDEIRILLEPAASGRCPGGELEYQRILQSHLEDIDERVTRLLGLRQQIQTLLLAERARIAPSACDLATCGCMEVAAPSTKPTEQTKKPASVYGCVCCQ
ncbi:MerR family transcriptional regulator [Marinobacter gelidimuriae]|uniref:MerR family transcriptional regulator n=1 Tax=Marinobacter gelidimuriae TaxID=2739064 RepID=UPI0003813F6B|nr:MerR family transcriptional regulator [Marinobacter gelidimuriae]